jgi:hypothetical protein
MRIALASHPDYLPWLHGTRALRVSAPLGSRVTEDGVQHLLGLGELR